MVNCSHRGCRRNPPLTCALSHLLNVRSPLVLALPGEERPLLLYKGLSIGVPLPLCYRASSGNGPLAPAAAL